jgi:hypothetical protein
MRLPVRADLIADGEPVLEDSLLGGDLDDPPPRSLCEGTDQDDLHLAATVDGAGVSRSRFGDSEPGDLMLLLTLCDRSSI